MKKMKRFFAVLLAMAMVLGMSVTAFAEEKDPTEDPHITINNLPAGTTDKPTKYKYLQIATAAPTDPIGWALVEGIELSNDVTIDDLVKLNGDNSNAASGTISSDVFKAIQNIDMSGVGLTAVPEGNTSAMIYDVTPGLYVIEVEAEGYAFSRMLAYVKYNDTNTAAVLETEVHAKGEEIKVSKSTSDGSVAVGDEIPYTVTVKYPYLNGEWNEASKQFTYPEFSITDAVTGGEVKKAGTTIALTDITIKIGNKEIGTGEGKLPISLVTVQAATPTAPQNDSFKVTFNYDPQYASQDVTIEYVVKVTDAVTTTAGLVNEVKSVIDTHTSEAKVINPTVSATITKKVADVVDGVDTGKGDLLPDARFKLYVVVENKDDATHVVESKNVNGKTFNTIVVKPETVDEGSTLLKEVVYEKELDGTAVDKDENNKFIGRKTGADGTVTFDKLDAQKTYWVIESKAPNGYSLNEEAQELTNTSFKAGTPTQDASGVWVTTNTADDFSGVTITDTKLSSLPSTGGIGTTIFTIGGCAIMIIAAGLFFATRRKSAK